jgi:hypothetical protein
MGGFEHRPEDIGLAVCSVLTVALQPGPLVKSHQCARGNPQLALVGFGDVERYEPVAPLVLDQRAVGAIEPSRQGSE